MRGLFVSCVCCCVVVGCPPPPPVIGIEGEGDGGEGEEGEGDEGEGEGEDVIDQVPLPARACVVVSADDVAGAVPHPFQPVIVEARLPLTRANGRVDVVAVLANDTVAFTAHNVGDLVFGDGAAACFVHVAAYDGLTVELSWSEPNNDVDLSLSQERDGAFCAPNQVEFVVDGVATADCHDDSICDYANCNPDGEAFTVDFDGAVQPRYFGDAIDGPAVELIVLPQPAGRFLATAHSYDNGPSSVVVRAFLDDVVIAVARDRLEANERGAPVLVDIDDGVSVDVAATCAGADCDVFVCPAACAGDCNDVDGGCRPCEGCGSDSCDHVTGHCHDRCRDGNDIVDGSVLAEAPVDDVVCPGDVDVFTIADVVAFDVVEVGVTPELDLVLEDATGVLDSGNFVQAVVRAPPVTVRLHNSQTEVGERTVRLSVDRLADRCAADDAVEPDDVTARVADTRADGVLCPAAEVDCVEFTADDDREFFLDRLAGDADCVIDPDVVDGCFDDGHRFFAAAGTPLRLCVRTTGTTPGTPWHIRSERPE